MATRVYTISELTHRIRAILEDEVGTVCVEGEITNFKAYSSGHRYFSLKDASAQTAHTIKHFFISVSPSFSVSAADGIRRRK